MMDSTITISTLLKRASYFGISQLEAQLLLVHILGCTRESLFINSNDVVDDAVAQQFIVDVQKVATGTPVEHITNVRWFYGRKFFVNEDVLIPRPETELLIDAVVEVIGTQTDVRVLDVGTGSGCIAVTLAAEMPKSSVTAVDISEAALEVAKKNATSHGVADTIVFKKSDLLDAVLDEEFDLIVANLPYIGLDEELELEVKVRDHEPKCALYGGQKGSELYGRFFSECSQLARKPKKIMCEVGSSQRSEITELIEKYLKEAKIEWRQDLARLDRLVIITL